MAAVFHATVRATRQARKGNPEYDENCECDWRKIGASSLCQMMTRVATFSICGALIFLAGVPLCAQDLQFVPEVDAYLKLNSVFRAYLQVKDNLDGDGNRRFVVGPSIQLSLKPLLKLKDVGVFDLEDTKHRSLVLEAGYRYITTPNSPDKDRLETAATFNFPMKAGFHLADRNRIDLDWQGGSFTWRYRNKLTVQRKFSVYTYQLIPYVAVEPQYNSKYSKWSTTALYAGCLFPVGKRLKFDTYYEHVNSTGRQPNRQRNEVGLALYLYFSL